MRSLYACPICLPRRNAFARYLARNRPRDSLGRSSRQKTRPVGRAKQKEEIVSNPTELVERYIASWNERDPKKRLDLVAKTYTEGAIYVDAHRSGDGHEGISKMVAAVHERFPDT